MSSTPIPTVPQNAARKRLFRLGALLFGLAVLVMAEITLRVLGLATPETSSDPLVGFSEIRPLFELDESGEQFQVAENRLAFFQPESFAAQKPAGEYRIFCFGGSTVQGRPYSIETSFTTWLELSLKAAQPDRNWKVVNCGGVSYASYRLLPLLEESLQHEPDLFIMYTGHNEFLEDRSYASVKHQPRWLRKLHGRALNLRLYGLLWSLKPNASRQPPADLPAEVDALLDYQGGLAQYHRDDQWRDGVVYEFERNLRQMVQRSNQANVPILLINPVCNLRDTPPFKVELSTELTTEQRDEVQRRWSDAKQASWDDLDEKLAKVCRVLELDERHAEAHFLHARTLEELGQSEQAGHAYCRAKDEDVCPLRMLEVMHDVLKEVGRETGTELIDIRAAFERDAEFGIPGDDQLIDHVHPRIEGHQKIAEEVFMVLARREIVVPQSGWKDQQSKLYEANFATLPENYFPESVERLRGLKRWAAGRVTRLKLAGQAAED